MKKHLVGLLFLGCLFVACKQTKDIPKVVESEYVKSNKVKVQKVIMQMFDGMRAGDSLMVRGAFIKSEVGMFTSFNKKDGTPIFHKGDLNGFIKAVGTPHEEVWNEVIHRYDILIEDNLAQAWTPYSFYLGDKLQHCGVNAFHLTKTENGWKIFHLADTRKREGCKTTD